mgnify:FL=1
MRQESACHRVSLRSPTLSVCVYVSIFVGLPQALEGPQLKRSSSKETVSLLLRGIKKLSKKYTARTRQLPSSLLRMSVVRTTCAVLVAFFLTYISGGHEDCQRAMKEAVEKLGGLDTLVNNAGILGSVGNNIETTSLEEWSRVLQTNLTSAFMLTQYACLKPG